MENVDIFYGVFYGSWFFGIHLVYFVAIRCILWPFGVFCGHSVYFVAVRYILGSFGIFLAILYIFGHFVYFVE
jgi:hypothetical protein